MSTTIDIPVSKIAPYVEMNIRTQLKANAEGKASACMMISGPPGIGKTAVFHDFCVKNDYGLVAKYMGTMMVEQITGLPKGLTDEKSVHTEWTIPEIFNFEKMLVTPSNPNRPIILFLDDIHLANKQIQAYQFQLLTYKAIHGHQLPKNVAIVMAGNRSEDKAGFNQIMAPISNRMVFVNTSVDHEQWVIQYAVPSKLRHDVITFIQQHPEMISGTPMESGPWPSPRSWSNCSRDMDEWEIMHGNIDVKALQCIVCGHVGTAVATKFIEYRNLFMQWEAALFLDGRRTLTNEEKSKFEGGNKIGAYCLLQACTGELIKRLRANNFKLNDSLNANIDVLKNLISGTFIKHASEIVPLGIQLIMLSEQANGNQSPIIARRLISDPEVIKRMGVLVEH